MTKSRLLALMALTLILTGCGNTSDSDDPNVFTHEYELCLENGVMVEYIVERPGELMPEGVGPPLQLYKIAGDDRCFGPENFAVTAEGPNCDETHYHGQATATDGSIKQDERPTACGFATVSELSHFVGHLAPDDDPRDTPPPTIYGEDIETDDNYCGPDITEALLSSMKRANSRLGALPDNEHGVYDGTAFLDRNGNNIDFRIKKQENCPSAACMAPDGQGTVIICGQCVMEHIANDMMFGFVANSLGVPFSIQLAGAHYAEYASYGGLDPLASQAAYVMGNAVSEAMSPGGALSIGDFCAVLNGAELETGIVTDSNAFEVQGEEQAFLKDCIPPPATCEVEVHKDFGSSRNWILAD